MRRIQQKDFPLLALRMEGPGGKKRVSRNWEWAQLTASQETGTVARSPVKELKSVWVWMSLDESPKLSLADTLTHILRTRARSHAVPRGVTHKNCEIINGFCFKVLALWKSVTQHRKWIHTTLNGLNVSYPRSIPKLLVGAGGNLPTMWTKSIRQAPGCWKYGATASTQPGSCTSGRIHICWITIFTWANLLVWLNVWEALVSILIQSWRSAISKT